MEPVKIGKQKFTKVKGVWMDQNKDLAPKDLIPLLDKLVPETPAQSFETGASQAVTSLTKLQKTTADSANKSSNDKLEKSMVKLASALEKLTKLIEKNDKLSNDNNNQKSASAARIYEPGEIPTIKEAMKANTKEFLHGKTNKYGETEERGLLKDLGSINPFKAMKYAAEDRRRQVIGSELREYEGTLTANNPSMSKKEIDEKIQQKRTELENLPASKSPQSSTSDKAKDIEEQKIADRKAAIAEGQQLASPDLDVKIQAVKIIDIDNSVIDKLKSAFKSDKKDEDKKEQPAEKEEPDEEDTSGFDIGDLFNNKRRRGGRGGRGRKPMPAKPEIVKDKAGKSRYAKGAVDPETGKKIGGQFVKETEQVAEAVAKPKAGIMSKILGGGAEAAEKAGVDTAKKAGLRVGGKSLIKSGLKKIPGLGLIAGGAFAAGRALKGDFVGAGLELASGAAGTLPGIGTAASVGIDAALAAKDMGAFGGAPGETPAGVPESAQPAAPEPAPKKSGGGILGKIGGFAKKNPLLAAGALVPGVGLAAIGAKKAWDMMKPAEMAPPQGTTDQTKSLTIATKQVEAAKEQKPMAIAPNITNITNSPSNISNNQGVIGGPTIGDRGSLNLNTF